MKFLRYFYETSGFWIGVIACYAAIIVMNVTYTPEELVSNAQNEVANSGFLAIASVMFIVSSYIGYHRKMKREAKVSSEQIV